MSEEFDALTRNKTWQLVPYHSKQKLVDCKWIFKTKFKADGSVQRYKARLVAKGFQQEPGVDYNETYSPVIKATTLRIILTLAVSYDWEIRQLDINNAFLNGQIQEDVFMKQPDGFVDSARPTHVCKLKKAIYGLKQAPRAWYDCLRITLHQWGFQNARSDNSLFLLHRGKLVVFILIYVDDIIVTGNNSVFLNSFIQKLHGMFSLKDLGSLHYFLGIEAYRDGSGIFLNQGKYTLDLLRRFNMLDASPCSSPMVTGRHYSIKDGDPLPNPVQYRQAIGALQYLTTTRPDIAFSVNKLSQFLSNPTNIHFQAVKRIFRYLKGTFHYGLHIQPSDDLSIVAFTDADWATCVDDRKSMAGYCIYYGNTLVSWASKKQRVVSRSSTESEYRALADTAAEVNWICSLLHEIHLPPQRTPILWCDNLSANAIASNPVHHGRTKHIELDIHFVRDQVLARKLEVRYVPSTSQVADGLTKALAHPQFSQLRTKLGLFPTPSRLRGGVKD